MQDQPTLRFSLRCEAGRRLCFRGFTQHILCVWSFVPHSHINSARADNSPPAGPFGTEFMSHNMGLCADPLPRCHADCFPPARRCGSHPRRHATARCVAVTAPACRHPSRQPPLPPLAQDGGRIAPPPTHPYCATLTSTPQGAGHRWHWHRYLLDLLVDLGFV